MSLKFWFINFRLSTDCSSVYTFCISITNNHYHEIFRYQLLLMTAFCRKCTKYSWFQSCWVRILSSVLCSQLDACPLRPHFSRRGFPEELSRPIWHTVLLANRNYVIFENFLLSSPCDYQSMKYFCLKRSKGVYEEFFPLHLDSTANFVLVEVPWSELHCYCFNASWQFAKCHYLMTQHRVLAKKPTPSTLEGKVSPTIQKYAEMYLGKIMHLFFCFPNHTTVSWQIDVSSRTSTELWHLTIMTRGPSLVSVHF